MRKVTALLLIAMLLIPATAFAEVKTFGYDDKRHRDSAIDGASFRMLWSYPIGKSYSQPLILDGARWGEPDKVKIIATGGNDLYGFTLPKNPEPKDWQNLWFNIQPDFGPEPLSGDKPTTSHPTFYQKGNKKYIAIGTYSKYLDIIDITDFDNPKIRQNIDTGYTTDITSAPLILNWNGYDILVAASGNTRRAILIADPFATPKVSYIDMATHGRVSSSPAPVKISGQMGFAMGVDQGREKGEVRVYILDDILKIQNGQIAKKSDNARMVATTRAGVAASFSVGDDGRVLYFGDTQSRAYAFDVEQQKRLWRNEDYKGIFSNRSPALTPSRVYLPAVGEVEDGRLVIIDRSTGKMVRGLDYQSLTRGGHDPRVQTAPVVMRGKKFDGTPQNIIAVGLSDGGIVFADPQGNFLYEETVAYTSSPKGRRGDYAWGATGEISAWGSWLVATGEENIVGLMFANYNYKAVSIESGVPQGEPAKPGQTYTGTITYEFEGYEIDMPVGLGVLVDGQYNYKMQNGPDVTPISELQWSAFDQSWFPEGMNPVEHYQAILPPGKHVYHFEWTAPQKPEVELAGFLNLNIPPVQVPRYNIGEYETNDNMVSIRVPIEQPCTDISVTLSRDTSTGEVFTGDEFIMEATIKRGYDGPAGPVDVKNTLDGPGIIDIKSGTITLNQGENKKISWFCRVQNPGTYTYKVTVDPVGVVDCAPGNNSASYTVNVQILVNDIPKSDKIRGELVH